MGRCNSPKRSCRSHSHTAECIDPHLECRWHQWHCYIVNDIESEGQTHTHRERERKGVHYTLPTYQALQEAPQEPLSLLLLLLLLLSLLLALESAATSTHTYTFNVAPVARMTMMATMHSQRNLPSSWVSALRNKNYNHAHSTHSTNWRNRNNERQHRISDAQQHNTFSIVYNARLALPTCTSMSYRHCKWNEREEQQASNDKVLPMAFEAVDHSNDHTILCAMLQCKRCISSATYQQYSNSSQCSFSTYHKPTCKNTSH
jgi:hypothetical protein